MPSPRKALIALGVACTVGAARVGHAQDPVPSGSIEGTVFDSLLTGGPLRGATVYVIGTTLITTTDARGRFTITGVPSGDQAVTFSHAAFDSAGLQAPIAQVKVTGLSATKLTLATPRGESLIKATCGKPQDRTGLLLGVVRDIETGNPLPRARVLSRWFELTIEKKGPRYQTLETSATSDAAGVFRLCNVPADIPVFVRARAAGHETGRMEVYFAGSDVLFRDFAVSLEDSAATVAPDSAFESSTDSAAIATIKGTGVARGVVRDVDGRPVPNAKIGLLDAAATVTSDGEGRFTLRDVPAGTQTLESRAIGYAPGRQAVVLKPNAPVDVDVKLLRTAQKLANISVIGTEKRGRLTKWGVEERRRRGIGFFMDAEEIAKKSGIYLGDVLRFAPGLTPMYSSKGRTYAMRSTATGDRCSPTYYLDGIRWYALDTSPILELERFISLNDLAAVEVYAGGAGLPMQFDSGTGCGAVAFWTK